MISKILTYIAVIFLVIVGEFVWVMAEGASINAKQWPTNFFYQYQKISLPEKEKVLRRIDATLQKLNKDGYGLIAKGAVLEKLGPAKPVYDRLTILDESGLIIIAHHVPNLYYHYRGEAAINPNIYIIIKNARLNVPESYIRYGFVVEGDFWAYAHKFVAAIIEGLEKAAGREDLKPPRPAGKAPAR